MAKSKPTPSTNKKPARATAKPLAPKADAQLPQVRVRMYRQGLGDCFLITFGTGAAQKHMLIDCGTLGTNATDVTMDKVAKNIATTTTAPNGKSSLEILVATHAHKDHVSGFLSQRKVFEQFDVRNVWMGWTEDPNDSLAIKLGNHAKALRAALAASYALPHASPGLKEKLASLIDFEAGELTGDQLAMGDTIAQALDIVRARAPGKPTYHSPGKPPIELPSIPGFRFYVLGPPRDADKLGSMGADGSDELYGLAKAAAAATAQGAALDAEAPFDARFCYSATQADHFFPRYASPSQHYRRIDGQWMEAVAELAAQLDRFRNNTSLALAIERIGDGRVLVFPADAQQGNWLSWHDADMKWTLKTDEGKVQTVLAADLLARAVFYKVGHHCSHNATARGKGLELMRKSPELTAFISVDRQVALKKSPPGSWRMPARALFRELLEACNGRVARADLGWAASAETAANLEVEHELAGLATPAEWSHWKTTQDASQNVQITPLYIDFTLK